MDFAVKLGAEVGEEVWVVWSRSVTREDDFGDAKTLGGAQNGADIVSGADVIEDKNEVHRGNYSTILCGIIGVCRI